MPHAVWPHRTVIALVLHGRANLQQIVNVHHFEATIIEEATLLTDALRLTLCAGLVADWISSCKTDWLNQLFSNYTLEGVGAQVIEIPGRKDARLSEVITTLTSANVGGDGSGGEALPLASCAEIKWRSVISSRHTRGRTYVSPIRDTRTTNNENQIATPNASPFSTYGNTLRGRYQETTGTSGVGVDLTVYSRPYDAPKGAYAKRVGGVLTVVNNTTNYDGDVNHIINSIVDPNVRQQRRREIGVGS